MSQTIPYPFELETERLLVRSASATVAPQLRDAVEETLDVLAPWMPWADHVPSLREIEENCVNGEKAFREGTGYRFHMFLKDQATFIGSIELFRIDWTVPKCELGYWVRKSHARRGYITEAVAQIVLYALDELQMNRVDIRTSTKNARSRRVPERLGFVLEGILRNDERHVDGSLRDTCVYAKVRAEPTRCLLTTVGTLNGA